MKKQATLSSLKRFISHLPNKWMIPVIIGIVIALSGFEIYLSYMFKTMLDQAIAKDLQKFFQVLIGAVVVISFQSALLFLKGRLSGGYAEKSVAVLRKKSVEKMMKLPISELSNNHSGDYISRLTNDMVKIETFMKETIIDLIFRPLNAILAFTYLCYLSWQLTIVTLVVVPALFMGVSALSGSIGKHSKELQQRLGTVNSLNQDAIQGIEISKAFNLSRVLRKKYDTEVDLSVETAKSLSRAKAIINGFSLVLGFTPFLVCFGVGGYFVIKGQMTAGSLIAFVNLLNHLTMPISNMPRLIAEAKSDMAAAGRIIEVIEKPSESMGNRSFNGSEDIAIKFDNVSFAYPNSENNVLKNISFEIKKGETVALVGPSGGGKSSIIKLLLGYFPDYEGSIQVMGGSLMDWDIDKLRNNVSIVAQDSYLFPTSIKENISYGKMDSQDKPIIQAAMLANCHNFITELKDGYDSNAGELGGRLSGGQKQRITIARAILKDAPILLLDEATSALDTQSEALIQQSLDDLMEGRTSLVIAHRLSTIKNAHRVLVIDEGEIVEQGTHQGLLKNNGLYTKLYLRQMEENETGKGGAA